MAQVSQEQKLTPRSHSKVTTLGFAFCTRKRWEIAWTMLGEGRQQLAVLKKKKKKIEERHQGGHLLHDIHFPASAGQEEKKCQLFLLGQKARIWGVSGSPTCFILSNRAVASQDERNPFYMAVPSAHSNILRFTVFLGLLSPLHRFFWVLWYPSKDSLMGKWNRTNCCRWRMAQGQGLDPGWGRTGLSSLLCPRSSVQPWPHRSSFPSYYLQR